MVIHVKVTGKVASPIFQNEFLVCNNSNYVVHFDFDKEWNDSVVKTARFVWGRNYYQDVIILNDEAVVPVLVDTNWIEIGAYTDNIQTTTGAFFNVRDSILKGSPVHPEPRTDQYDEIIELINSGAVKGPKGEDGFSPSANVHKIGKVSTLTVTDKSGTTSVEIYDGSGGESVSKWSQITDKPFENIDVNTLKVAGNTLMVNTTDDAEGDNTKPITSSGVHVIVGNINTLLSRI